MTRPEAIALARQMYGDGDAWNITEIQKHLNARGVNCAWSTVKGWVDPEYQQRRELSDRDRKRREWRRAHGPRAFRVLDDDARAAVIGLLRDDAGLSDEQVQAVMRIVFRDTAKLSKAVENAERVLPPWAPDAGEVFDRMRALRDAGLTFTGIANVIRLDYGVPMGAEDARYALNLGRPSDRWRWMGIRMSPGDAVPAGPVVRRRRGWWHADALEMIRANPGVTNLEVAERFGVDPSSVRYVRKKAAA